jgi:guanine nucleotide exchange factor
MSEHEPEGTVLCVHSVSVDESFRRRGVAVRMLKVYHDFVRETTPHVKELRLISKEYLTDLYKAAGYSLVGPSAVVHGVDPWMEMRAPLRSAEEMETLDRKRRTWYF